MSPGLLERSRRRGGAVSRRRPGRYVPSGDRWLGALLACEAVQADVRRYVEGRNDE